MNIYPDRLPVDILDLGNPDKDAAPKFDVRAPWRLGKASGSDLADEATHAVAADYAADSDKLDGHDASYFATSASSYQCTTETLTTSTTHAQFSNDYRIFMNSGTAVNLDITNGASSSGIVVSICNLGAGAVTVKTGLAATYGSDLTFTLAAGQVTLMWDGQYWVCASANGDIQVFITASTTWMAPFSAVWDLGAMGGGGGGGGAKNSDEACAGGGGSASLVWGSVWMCMGAQATVTIGAAGAAGSTAPGNGGTGGTTRIAVESLIVQSGGGLGGVLSTGTNGTGGAAGNRIVATAAGVFNLGLGHPRDIAGKSGENGSTGYDYGGAGAESVFGPGGARGGPGQAAPATSYGAGGGGARATGSHGIAGGLGAAGCAVMRPAV